MRFGLKAATITLTEAGDVGSPNALLRDASDGRAILRTGCFLPRLLGPRPVEKYSPTGRFGKRVEAFPMA